VAGGRTVGVAENPTTQGARQGSTTSHPFLVRNIVRTIVIIGASNVTFSLPVIWSTLRQSLNDPFRLMVAAGHGRSFGIPSTVLGRTLPSILECGLWESLERLNSSTTHALVTDVGNDLLYGVDATQTMSWVTETIDRLESQASNILVTGLPIESLRGLSARRFDFFRRLMFPRSNLAFECALSESDAIHRQLLETGGNQAVTNLVPEERWYGLDPIHIRRRCRREAWNRYLSLCLPDVNLTSCGLVPDFSAWRGCAERRWKRSRLLTSQQPTQTDHGNELWLY